MSRNIIQTCQINDFNDWSFTFVRSYFCDDIFSSIVYKGTADGDCSWCMLRRLMSVKHSSEEIVVNLTIVPWKRIILKQFQCVCAKVCVFQNASKYLVYSLLLKLRDRQLNACGLSSALMDNQNVIILIDGDKNYIKIIPKARYGCCWNDNKKSHGITTMVLT